MVKLSFMTEFILMVLILPDGNVETLLFEIELSEKHLWKIFVSFTYGEFRSEAEFVTENEARSNSSFPYDDIDEAAEAQPLTSQTTTAGASGGNYIHEDQSPGKFWTSPFTLFSHINTNPYITSDLTN